jgi:hypothetical protein
MLVAIPEGAAAWLIAPRKEGQNKYFAGEGSLVLSVVALQFSFALPSKCAPLHSVPSKSLPRDCHRTPCAVS